MRRLPSSGFTCATDNDADTNGTDDCDIDKGPSQAILRVALMSSPESDHLSLRVEQGTPRAWSMISRILKKSELMPVGLPHFSNIASRSCLAGCTLNPSGYHQTAIVN